MNRPIRLLLVDDHAIVREGLRTLLREEADIEVVGEAADGDAGLREAVRLKPDVILMDLVMPGMNGIELLGRLKPIKLAARVLVLTSFAGDRQVREAVQAGAIGYLMKDVLKPDLLAAIRAAAQGKPTLHPDAQRSLMQEVSGGETPLAGLTAREVTVLRLIAQGQSNKGIAENLQLSVGTVKGYVSAIFVKLGVEDRTQAALFAVKHGLVEAAGG